MALWYVATTGNDGGAGSLGDPFLTIAHALTVVTAGDTIFLRAGSYAESIDATAYAIPSGTSGNEITLTHYAAEVATITGSGSILLNLANAVANASYLRFVELIWDASGQTPGNILVVGSGSHHITFDGCEVIGVVADTVGRGLRTYVGSSDVTLTDCWFHDNGRYGLDLRGETHLVEGCLIEGTTAYGIQLYGGNTSLVRRCTFFDNGGGAVNTEGAIFVGPGDGHRIENCLFAGNYNGIVVSGASTNMGLYNLTIDTSTQYGLWIADATPLDVTLTNTILYASGTADLQDNGTPGELTQTTNLVGTNPLFVNGGARDFHLVYASPGAETGTDLSGLFTVDLANTSRVGAWDIGAYAVTATMVPVGVTVSPRPVSVRQRAVSKPTLVRVTATILLGHTNYTPHLTPPPVQVQARLGLPYVARVTTGTVVLPRGGPSTSGTVNPWKVDQLGYRPTATKIALWSEPYVGYNTRGTPPGPGPRVYLKAVPSGQIVWEGHIRLTRWQSGYTDTVSGDAAWWADFSAYRTPGRYVLVAPGTGHVSAPFTISATVYHEALAVASKTWFYQRCGVAKAATEAGGWADGSACHLGTGQTSAARDVLDPTNPATALDLRGGHHEGGSYTKYTVYTAIWLHDVLWAYRHHPTIWSDSTSIPESSNGIPDILDECQIALNGLRLHQLGNGSVLSKSGPVTAGQVGPPSTDTDPWYWGTASTASTGHAASAFAHGALAFTQAGQTAYATTLLAAAEAAWTWASANPSVDYTNPGFLSANPEPTAFGSAYGRSMALLLAASYLYAATGTSTYRAYVDAHYTESLAMNFDWGWYPGEQGTQLGLYVYTQAAGATSSVVTDILTRSGNSFWVNDPWRASQRGTDPYRSSIYTWALGSNHLHAQTGNFMLDIIRFGASSLRHPDIRTAAEQYLHYLHGVNPNDVCFLSNMGGYGATASVRQLWHQWFRTGTAWDDAQGSVYGPPPGFLVGGPNPGYTGNAGSPPSSQPSAKSWKDFNDEGAANAWELTEPSLATQAAYLRLLAYFVDLET